jgi:hypothetical protein
MDDKTWTVLLVVTSVILIALFIHQCDISVKCNSAMESFEGAPNNLKWVPRPAYCRHGRTTCEQCVHGFNYV